MAEQLWRETMDGIDSAYVVWLGEKDGKPKVYVTPVARAAGAPVIPDGEDAATERVLEAWLRWGQMEPHPGDAVFKAEMRDFVRDMVRAACGEV